MRQRYIFITQINQAIFEFFQCSPINIGDSPLTIHVATKQHKIQLRAILNHFRKLFCGIKRQRFNTISEIKYRRRLIFYKKSYNEVGFSITCRTRNMLFVRINALIVTIKGTIKADCGTTPEYSAS